MSLPYPTMTAEEAAEACAGAGVSTEAVADAGSAAKDRFACNRKIAAKQAKEKPVERISKGRFVSGHDL